MAVQVKECKEKECKGKSTSAQEQRAGVAQGDDAESWQRALPALTQAIRPPLFAAPLRATFTRV